MKRMLVIAALLAVPALGCSSSASEDGLPSDRTVLKDIRSNMTTEIADLELTGGFMLNRENPAAPLPDRATRQFAVQTTRADDGGYLTFDALAIYYRTGPTAWRFDRVFTLEDSMRLHGIDALSSDEVRAAVERSLASPTMGLRPDRVVHVYSIEVLTDPPITSKTRSRASAAVSVEYDFARTTTIERRLAVMTVSLGQHEGQWNAIEDDTLEEKTLSSEDWDAEAIDALPRLNSAGLAGMYGAERAFAAVKTPDIPLPDKQQVLDALSHTISINADWFRKILGPQVSDEMIDLKSFDPQMDTLSRVGRDLFSIEGRLVFTRKEISGRLHEARQDYTLFIKGNTERYAAVRATTEGPVRLGKALPDAPTDVANRQLLVDSLYAGRR